MHLSDVQASTLTPRTQLPGCSVERLALVSILSRSDAEFAEFKGKVPLEEYLVFKVGGWGDILGWGGGRFMCFKMRGQVKVPLEEYQVVKVGGGVNWTGAGMSAVCVRVHVCVLQPVHSAQLRLGNPGWARSRYRGLQQTRAVAVPVILRS